MDSKNWHGKGNLVKIVDDFGVERVGLILSHRYGYEEWGGGGRFSVCKVMSEGRMEHWKVGGFSNWSYRRNPGVTRRWFQNPWPTVISFG